MGSIRSNFKFSILGGPHPCRGGGLRRSPVARDVQAPRVGHLVVVRGQRHVRGRARGPDQGLWTDLSRAVSYVMTLQPMQGIILLAGTHIICYIPAWRYARANGCTSQRGANLKMHSGSTTVHVLWCCVNVCGPKRFDMWDNVAFAPLLLLCRCITCVWCNVRLSCQHVP